MTDLIAERREVALTHRNYLYELPPLVGVRFHVRLDFAGIEFIAALTGVDQSTARVLFAHETDERVLLPVSLGLIISMKQVTWVTHAEEESP